MQPGALWLLLGLLAACGATEVYALYSTGTVGWDRTVPVCFSPDSMVRPEYTAYSQKMKAVLARSWQQATGLSFTGWGACPSPGTPGTINVGLNTLDPNGGAQTYRDGSRVDINIAIFPTIAGFTDALIIHEFGHALGFEHEMTRPDFVDYDGCRESNVEGGDALDTIPDKHSALNATYCHFNPELSYWDIVGAQNYWGHPNYFADVTGDGIDDALVVNYDGVYVRPTNSQGYMPASAQQNWTGWGFWGSKGTFFADVTGDKRADAIAVNEDGVWVRSSDGTGFRNDERNWTGQGFWGTRGTYFADVTGDGKADAIVVNEDGVWVRRSNGTTFDPETRWLAVLPNTRSAGNFFADVTGDKRADLITVNDNGVLVNAAIATTTGGFSPTAVNWTAGQTFVGERGTYFADVNGDGKADALAVKDDGLWVRHSYKGKKFSSAYKITGVTTGARGLFFARSNTGATVEALRVEEDGIYIRFLYGSSKGVTYNATGGAFYGLW
jgi:hypothetical protein